MAKTYTIEIELSEDFQHAAEIANQDPEGLIKNFVRRYSEGFKEDNYSSYEEYQVAMIQKGMADIDNNQTITQEKSHAQFLERKQRFKEKYS